MSFLPTFGAVGDFISVGALIIKITRALSDSRGSKTEYGTVVQELRALKTELTHIEALYHGLPRSQELDMSRVTSETLIRRCRDRIEAFSAEIGKYEAGLNPQVSKNRIRSAVAKIRWMHNKDSFGTLKEGLMSCCETINMHLSATVMTMIQHYHYEAQANFEELNRITSLIESTSSNNLTSIESCTMKTYLEVVDLAKLLNAKVERPLTEEVFTLHDAAGREAPVPLRLIDCWEAFEAVLTARFRGRPGQRRVARGRYVVFDGVLGKDIPRNSDWSSSFLPGRVIVMSIICQTQPLIDVEDEDIVCPRCKSFSDVILGTERRCLRCRLRYRRLVEDEVAEEEPALGLQSRRNRDLCGSTQLQQPSSKKYTVTSTSYSEKTQSSERDDSQNIHEGIQSVSLSQIQNPSANIRADSIYSEDSCSYYATSTSTHSNEYSLTAFSAVVITQGTWSEGETRAQEESNI